MGMIVSILFTLEFFHFLTHVMVLSGWRMLPRRILAKQRIYFMVDLVCVAASYLIHRKYLPFILLQNLQHLYYFFTWEKSGPSKRVVSWSSLDWDRGRWNQIDLVLGTLFDTLIHAINASLLIQHVSSSSATILIVSLIITFLMAMLVVFNPKLAWANPAAQIPDWIKLRMR